MLECSCHIISYLADVMNALRQSGAGGGQGSTQLLVEGEEKAIEVDSDWVEELAVEEDDSQAEDSVSLCLIYVLYEKFSEDLDCHRWEICSLFSSCSSMLPFRMKTRYATNYAPSPSPRKSS